MTSIEHGSGHDATGRRQWSSLHAYNTAVGYQAGHDVTTGVENTIIGALAGDALTDADYNVAVGVSALSSDTKGGQFNCYWLSSLIDAKLHFKC